LAENELWLSVKSLDNKGRQLFWTKGIASAITALSVLYSELRVQGEELICPEDLSEKEAVNSSKNAMMIAVPME
jgi:hypothetical protein